MAGVYSVSQVTAYIKNMFRQDFALNRLSVKGEVSNCKYHPSGHIYFTLKDKGSTLACVMFSGQRKGLDFQLKEGQQVVVSGSVDVYERDGRYQMYAKEIVLDGRGDLFARFEELRKRLEEMGMFAPEYKQPIPKYARTVGIVTASTGAAIQDIINISRRRNPYVQLILYPAIVQGEEAKYSIVRGIETLDRMGLDVIIVGRGGGSIEDLWAFNEEIVARAIFNCSTPVISAVGHETDVTIADYVADMRAPTPSAAAELAVFDYYILKNTLETYRKRLLNGLLRTVENKSYQLRFLESRFQLHHPGRTLNEKRQRLLDIEDQLRMLTERKAASCRQRADLISDRMKVLMDKKDQQTRHRLGILSERLEGLSPVKSIARGYGYVTGPDGRRLDSVDKIKIGDRFQVQLGDGTVTGRAEEVARKELQ